MWGKDDSLKNTYALENICYIIKKIIYISQKKNQIVKQLQFAFRIFQVKNIKDYKGQKKKSNSAIFNLAVKDKNKWFINSMQIQATFMESDLQQLWIFFNRDIVPYYVDQALISKPLLMSNECRILVYVTY